MAKAKRACRECRTIVDTGNVCPNCGSTNISSKVEGYVVILDSDSDLGDMLGAEEGEYGVAVL